MNLNVVEPPRARVSGLPLALAGAAFVMAGYLVWERVSPRSLLGDAQPRPVASRGDLADFEKVAIAINERVSPSVVHIRAPGMRVRVNPWQYGDLPEGTGTGFVWDDRGYIVTNFHVVANRDVVEVEMLGLTAIPADVIGAEPDLDTAVIKLRTLPSGLVPIAIGTSKELKVGQAVFAIGNPFGLDHSMSSGIISAIDRIMQSVVGTPIEGVIQTDASINPGNSGGPLLDSAGRLIGMNTAIKSPSGASAGIGFAIPVDSINRVVPRLIRGEQRKPPILGVHLDQRVRLDGEERRMVTQVVEGTGADEAGLRGANSEAKVVGDVIVSIDGHPVHRLEDIWAILDQRQVGDTVRVGVARDADSNARKDLVIPVRLSPAREVSTQGR